MCDIVAEWSTEIDDGQQLLRSMVKGKCERLKEFENNVNHRILKMI